MLVTAASPNSVSASTFIGYGMIRRLLLSSKIPNSVTTGAMISLIYDSGSLTVSQEFPA
jgi:hypothetical protein